MQWPRDRRSPINVALLLALAIVCGICGMSTFTGAVILLIGKNMDALAYGLAEQHTFFFPGLFLQFPVAYIAVTWAMLVGAGTLITILSHYTDHHRQNSSPAASPSA